jgi:hypothetical protein
VLRQERLRDGRTDQPQTEQFWLVWFEDWWYFTLDPDLPLAFEDEPNIGFNVPLCGKDPSGNAYAYNVPTGLAIRMPSNAKGKVMHTLSLMSGSHAWGVPFHLCTDDVGDILDAETASAAAAFDKDEVQDEAQDAEEDAEATLVAEQSRLETEGIVGDLVAPLVDYLGDVAWQRLTPSLCQNENNMP